MLLDLFVQGGPIMWPLLLTSLVALTIVIERAVFIVREGFRRKPETVAAILEAVERGEPERAAQIGRDSPDFVARTLTYGLAHRKKSVSDAMLRAAHRELARFSRGIGILDTIITLAPLLGLLGTVTGMIHSFDLLGGNELGSPAAITGGIAEALIATAFGLGIAIIALIPYNYLNARLEEARLQIQDAASHLELHLACAPAAAPPGSAPALA